MYADDSTIHISGENISDIQTKVQEDLNRIVVHFPPDLKIGDNFTFFLYIWINATVYYSVEHIS
jgi:hypothetical protein